jgi:hypothetical protein
MGMEGMDRERFPSYLEVKKDVRQTVVMSPYTTKFVEIRVISLINLFSTERPKLRESKQNNCFSVHKI